MPNHGRYAGHGPLQPASEVGAHCADIGAGGAIEDVSLVAYQSNGF